MPFTGCFYCRDIGISQISFKKRVPPWAILRRADLPPFTAPVKAHSSYPKSSLSNKFSGKVAQLIAKKGSNLCGL